MAKRTLNKVGQRLWNRYVILKVLENNPMSSEDLIRVVSPDYFATSKAGTPNPVRKRGGIRKSITALANHGEIDEVRGILRLAKGVDIGEKPRSSFDKEETITSPEPVKKVQANDNILFRWGEPIVRSSKPGKLQLSRLGGILRGVQIDLWDFIEVEITRIELWGKASPVNNRIVSLNIPQDQCFRVVLGRSVYSTFESEEVSVIAFHLKEPNKTRTLYLASPTFVSIIFED